MIAYKFLAAGARGPFTGVAWPAIGEWLVATGPGIHACRADQLAHWLHDELWEVELADTRDGPDCVIAARARLVRRVDWDPRAFADACLARANDADAAEANAHGYPAIAAYMAATAIASDDEDAYARERAWQSAWIAARL